MLLLSFVIISLLNLCAADEPYYKAEFVKSLPKGYIYDSAWSISCDKMKTPIVYDVDLDSIGDSIYVRTIKPQKGRVRSWRNLNWLQVAFKLSKTGKYAILSGVIDDDPSSGLRVSCGNPYDLRLTSDSCTKKGRFEFHHGIPSGYDEKTIKDYSDKVQYYYPDLSWMRNASKMSEVRDSCSKLMNIKRCTQEQTMVHFRWLRGYHFEIDSDTLKIYSADQHFEACNDTLSEKR